MNGKKKNKNLSIHADCETRFRYMRTSQYEMKRIDKESMQMERKRKLGQLYLHIR